MGEVAVSRQNHFAVWGRNYKRWSDRTLQDYSYYVGVASRSLQLETVDEKALKWFLFPIESPVKRNRMRAALDGYFQFLIAEEIRSDNPAAGIPRLPERRPLPKPLPRELVPQLVAAARPKGQRAYTLTVAYLFSGLRMSEVRRFEWSRLEGGWMFITAKGAQERAVWLPQIVIEALEDLPRISRWVFPSPSKEDSPISDDTVERTIRSVGETIGIRCWPHRLRHTFATELYEETGDIYLVKAALGHRSIQSTEIYTQVRPLRVKVQIDQLSFGMDVVKSNGNKGVHDGSHTSIYRRAVSSERMR